MDSTKANELMEALHLAALKAGGSFHKVRYVPHDCYAACSIQLGPIVFAAEFDDAEGAAGAFSIKGPVRWTAEWSELMGSVFVADPEGSEDWMAWATRGIEMAGKGRNAAWENR